MVQGHAHGADVAHVEAGLHGRVAPAVVRRRADVAALVAVFLVVVLPVGAAFYRRVRDKRVGVRPGGHLAVKALLGENPRHPVRDAELRVERYSVCFPADDLLLPFGLSESREFVHVGPAASVRGLDSLGAGRGGQCRREQHCRDSSSRFRSGLAAYPCEFLPDVFQRTLPVRREPFPAEPELHGKYEHGYQQACRGTCVIVEGKPVAVIDCTPYDGLADIVGKAHPPVRYGGALEAVAVRPVPQQDEKRHPESGKEKACERIDYEVQARIGPRLHL